ncbi:hypothetical protein GX563_06825 [Candidatus Bathyarchaeota archaeon]|nr:hypothetical protein [Candidatus Bathyarchaeota archaeon]
MTITVKTIWKTQKDDEVCATCKALDGYTWSFDANEPYPKQLIHPLYGPVYDLRPAANGSLIKEKRGRRCRCSLEHQFDVSGAGTDEDSRSDKQTPSIKIVEE